MLIECHKDWSISSLLSQVSLNHWRHSETKCLSVFSHIWVYALVCDFEVHEIRCWWVLLMVSGKPLSSHTRWLLMFVQVWFQCKCFSATAADVRFICRMCLDVRSEVWLVGKCFSTLLALKWFFARVGSDMTLKKPRTWKSLSAKTALAPLVVRPDVHTVGWHGNVDFVAVRTLAGFLVCDWPMSLSVSCEVRAGWVSLPTIWTDEIFSHTVHLRPSSFNEILDVVCTSHIPHVYQFPSCFDFKRSRWGW